MGVIKKQGIQNTIVTYFGIILGFVNLIIVQPFFLSPEEIGLIRVLFSFSSLIAVFLPLGVGQITIRYFPKFRNSEKKHHGYFGFMLLFPAAGFLLVTAALYLTRDFFIQQYSDQSALFVEFFDYIFPLSLFLGLINVLNIYSFSLFRTTFPSLLNDVISRIFTIAVIAAYFVNILTLDELVFCFVFVSGFQLIILLLFIYIIDKPSLKVDFKAVKTQNLNEILQYGFLLSFASIASLGLKYLDSIMIARYLPLAAVGIYTIAAFIPTVIEAPLFALDKIAGTKISQALAVNNTKEIKEIYFKSSRYMLLIGGLLFIGINININSLLSLLPPEFEGGEWVVFIISIGTFFTMAAGSNTSIIFNSNKYKFGAFLLIFLVIIAFISNVILIPIMGIEGAALATAIASFIYNLLKYLFIWKQFKMQPFDFTSLKVLFIILLVFLIGYSLPSYVNPVVAILYKSIIVTIIYLILSFLLKVDDELINSIKKFFK